MKEIATMNGSLCAQTQHPSVDDCGSRSRNTNLDSGLELDDELFINNIIAPFLMSKGGSPVDGLVSTGKILSSRFSDSVYSR